jgi:hypothetical protein
MRRKARGELAPVVCFSHHVRSPHPFAGAAYPEFVRASHVLLLPPRVRPFYDYFRPRYINLHYYIIHYSKYDIILVQPRWDGMLPLPHMSQITAYPNRPFPLNADRAIFRCCNSCCHLPITMTGHKPKSNKK